jgi:hypothetical protein|tara:strand:- start:209 stop:385 length:177 start_codon:yes stop_codon:yes gene_type:complete
MTFTEYCTTLETMIKDTTSQLSDADLDQINSSIEDSDAGTGKIWLEDFVDSEAKLRNR